MSEPDRSTWSDAELVNELLEIGIPKNFRATLLGAMGDARKGGERFCAPYVVLLRNALERLEHFTFNERWAAKGLDEEAQKVHDMVQAALAGAPK